MQDKYPALMTQGDLIDRHKEHVVTIEQLRAANAKLEQDVEELKHSGGLVVPMNLQRAKEVGRQIGLSQRVVQIDDLRAANVELEARYSASQAALAELATSHRVVTEANVDLESEVALKDAALADSAETITILRDASAANANLTREVERKDKDDGPLTSTSSAYEWQKLCADLSQELNGLRWKHYQLVKAAKEYIESRKKQTVRFQDAKDLSANESANEALCALIYDDE